MSEMQNLNPNGEGSKLIRDKNLEDQQNDRQGKPWKERLAEATQTLMKFKGGRASLEQRVIEAEHYYRLHNWWSKQNVNKKYGVKSNSGWLFSSCMNKHSDAMDNYPEPNVLPRESADEQTAKLLSEVLPCVLELNDYEKIYDDGWWDKLIKGTAVYAATWDSDENNGLGEISIKRVDVLNCFWDPSCANIQDGKDFFFVSLMDIEELREEYGDDVADNVAAVPNITPGMYAYETNHDNVGKVAVIDWYYKRNGVLQYAKYVEDELLYASEDDERYAERGYYDHGMYPFIFDPLYLMEGSPAGFGHVDLCRDAQDYIDRMDSIILDSALINGRPKYFFNNQGGVNEDDILDPERPLVKVNGAGAIQESIMPFGKSELNPLYVQVLNSKINELRETSGSTEAAQGGAPASVTAYSAIAALQEASGKTSRNMIRGSYRCFKDLCYMLIELMRQFYDEPRVYRITGNGQPQYVEFDNTAMQGQMMVGATGETYRTKEPVYDIKVKPSKQTTYSRMAQNELAKELYGAGVFAPQNADSALAMLDMMEFEGKDNVVQKVQQNGTMMQVIQQLSMQVQQLSAMLGIAQNGEVGSRSEEVGVNNTPDIQQSKQEPKTDSLGNEQQTGKRINAPKERAAAAASV